MGGNVCLILLNRKTSVVAIDVDAFIDSNLYRYTKRVKIKQCIVVSMRVSIASDNSRDNTPQH